MAELVIFEDYKYRDLLPLVYCRACFELRCGYDSLLERIRRAWPDAQVRLYVRPELQEVVAERFELPVNRPPSGEAVFVNGRLVGGLDASQLRPNCYGLCDSNVVYVWADEASARRFGPEVFLEPQRLELAVRHMQHQQCRPSEPGLIGYPWDLVHANERLLLSDWRQLGRESIEGQLCEGAHILNRSAVHIGSGSRIKPCAVLDAEDGPIYIGHDVTVSPHCTIQGPCYIGDGSLIQPGAVIREGTSIGPVCKVGGELECTIIHGYSNKQHTGFLGHSYVGEWVNIGAGCSNSDLKNTYGPVRVPINGQEIDSGQTFVGATIGDHCKTSINASLATGSVVGLCCSLFVSGYPPKFIPSFSWYTDAGRSEYDVHRALAVARKMMARRKKQLSPAMERLFLRLPQIARAHERTDQTKD